MCQIGTSEKTMSRNSDSHQYVDESFHRDDDDIKYFVDLYTTALHLRQRMKEEKLIHHTYSAYFNDENNNNNLYSLFHNCFHSYETINWLIKRQLCKTIDDGLEIFKVLEKLKIIHHVCDFNEFEYPLLPSSNNNVKYLYRFRLDDGTTDQNRSFQQFASIYETYTSLFTLDKSQCRGVDLQQEQTSRNPYDENSGILLNGDNLARMLALRSGTNMLNIERLVDDMIIYGLVRFNECHQESECNCSGKFRNDDHHQYILSSSHRLIPKQRLDLIALMQNDLHETRQSPILNEDIRTSISSNSIYSNESTRKISNSDENDCTTKVTCPTNSFKRKKSASLNSAANSEHRPTADELERRELPWCWRSYSLKRDRRGYGLILQGQGPCYVERLDPYGSAFTSGIRVNEYLYAIEGVIVLRRSGKEVERLLSMFDKCTVYTIYNRDDFRQLSTPRNELNSKNDIDCFKHLSSALNDYNTRKTSSTTTLNSHSLNHITQQQHQLSYSSSPTSSMEESLPCSISPKHSQQYSNNKKSALTKHFQFFRLTSRSCSNTLK
ncbi:unnamed protein product [Rotaria sp. Silwood2]|nr:unnamed protein product [Rotaria sp. Silwood2]CAF2555288.1 unnamed protein product [Rotaria sp. Silwood2]CAF3901655.1 unnamed protein product [Rotaria sp. Silwood2]CAF3948591.1 unnamed protein product [Rotaria sp. Silwood2]